MKAHFLQPILKPGQHEGLLRNSRNGQVVAARLETAFSSAERNKGLLGRTGLDPGSALVIAPCNAIHMFFMKFPIDVAFVDRRGRLVKGVRRIQPWRIAFGLGAFAAIELPEGTLERTGTEKGDELLLELQPFQALTDR